MNKPGHTNLSQSPTGSQLGCIWLFSVNVNTKIVYSVSPFVVKLWPSVTYPAAILWIHPLPLSNSSRWGLKLFLFLISQLLLSTHDGSIHFFHFPSLPFPSLPFLLFSFYFLRFLPSFHSLFYSALLSFFFSPFVLGHTWPWSGLTSGSTLGDDSWQDSDEYTWFWKLNLWVSFCARQLPYPAPPTVLPCRPPYFILCLIQ